jgi:hypothetical protein
LRLDVDLQGLKVLEGEESVPVGDAVGVESSIVLTAEELDMHLLKNTDIVEIFDRGRI